MSLEAKSAVEIDKQVWGKVELDLTQRRLDANLLSKLPSRFDGKLSVNAKSSVEIDEQIWRKLRLMSLEAKSAVEIDEQIWGIVELDELGGKICCRNWRADLSYSWPWFDAKLPSKLKSRFDGKLSLITLEAKSAVEIDEQSWRKVEPDELGGKICCRNWQAGLRKTWAWFDTKTVRRKSTVKIAEHIWRKVELDLTQICCQNCRADLTESCAWWA